MPIWIWMAFFLCGFLLVFGMSLAFSKQPASLRERLSGVIGQASDRSGTGRFSNIFSRILPTLLLGFSKSLWFLNPSGKFKQRLLMAGVYQPEAPRMLFACQFLLAIGLFANVYFMPWHHPASARLQFPLSLWMAGVGFLAPRFWLNQRVRKRWRAVLQSLPDFVDLLTVCVQAGLGLNQALVRVGREFQKSNPVLGGELHILDLELRSGKPREECLRALYTRTGVEDVKTFAAVLIHADRYGLSIGTTLRVFSETIRTTRRQAIEEAAAKTALKIAFPLVLFIFPALMIIILGPAAVTFLMRGLGV